MEDIDVGIFNAIKQDDLASFESYVQDNLSISFGRFPILSLCYLYNSKKIIKKYESELIKIKSYNYLPENTEMYLKFKAVADRKLRLYVGENKLVSPLEMLLILGEATKVENLYKDAYKSATIQENLKFIESIKSSQDIEVGETKIKIPKQKMKKQSKKIVVLVASIAIFMIAVSTVAAILFMNLGIGTEQNPYVISNGKQLQKAVSTNSHIVLTSDVELDSLALDNFTGSIDGSGHELAVKVSAPLVKKFEGTIKNLTINMDVDVSTNVDMGLLCNEFKGTIDNVTINAKGKITYTGSATTGSVYIGVVAKENKATISNVRSNLELEVIGNGTSSIVFAGICGINDETIQNVELLGSVKGTEVQIAGVANSNLGEIDSITSALQIKHVSSVEYAKSLAAGIATENYGSISNAIVSGNIEVENLNENGSNMFVGGICTYNAAVITNSKFNSNINIVTAYVALRAGGICAQSEYDYINLAIAPAITNCASVGAINVSYEDTRSFGYIGGIVGESQTYLESAKSFSTTTIALPNITADFKAAGLIGILNGNLAMDECAYIKSSSILYGLCTTTMFGGYKYYERADGVFEYYTTEDEIKALEIYW